MYKLVKPRTSAASGGLWEEQGCRKDNCSCFLDGLREWRRPQEVLLLPSSLTHVFLDGVGMLNTQDPLAH